MSIRFAPFFLITTLIGSTYVYAADNAYNEGVAAYQAKNYAMAREQWSKSADNGDISALNNLGYLLYYGLGGEPDMNRALDLWKKAATLGHSESQWHLGEAFASGKAITQDRVLAYAWYRCAITSAELALNEEKDAEAGIAQDARKSLVELLPLLSPDEFKSGEDLAKQYITNYAQRSNT